MLKVWTRTLETLTAVSLVAVIVLLAASPALAADGSSDDAIVVFNGDIHVAEEDAADDVIAFNGAVEIDGDVGGNVIAFNGPVSITGDVTGDVIAFNGVIRVEDGATVDGNVLGRSAPIIDDGATIGGDTGSINVDAFDVAGDLVDAGLWVAISFSMLILAFALVMFLPRATDRFVTTSTDNTAAAIGWGLALFVGVPIIGALFAVTIVGLPLGVGLFLLLAPLFALAYSVGGYVLGRAIVKPPGSRYLAALVGIGILRGVALIPVLGGLAWFAATVFGLGIIVVSAAAARPREVPGIPAPMPGMLP